jgi:hypothetical protein
MGYYHLARIVIVPNGWTKLDAELFLQILHVVVSAKRISKLSWCLEKGFTNGSSIYLSSYILLPSLAKKYKFNQKQTSNHIRACTNYWECCSADQCCTITTSNAADQFAGTYVLLLHKQTEVVALDALKYSYRSNFFCIQIAIFSQNCYSML